MQAKIPEAKADDLGHARDRILARFRETRARTDRLAAPLSPEDQQLQSMPSASPTKWHRAHVSWFFETFVLVPAGLEVVDRRYEYLFNSYYDTVGPRHPRGERGMLSRPSVTEIASYGQRVSQSVEAVVSAAGAERLRQILPIVELGIAHEEQHQELILTDILHAFSHHRYCPSYLPVASSPAAPAAPLPMSFVESAGGLVEIGASDEGFAFDNERPRHKRWLEPFALADRLVSVGELKAFIRDGGYRTPSLWLAEGFDFVRDRGLTAPLYYDQADDGSLTVFSLAGRVAAMDDEPVVHVSYYEADAIARYLGARLPTEAEWEAFAAGGAVVGNFVDGGELRPLPATVGAADVRGVRQLFGDAWEWTHSSYDAYPGYRPAAGALGEYNGKFMVGQMVLRGGSCLTTEKHVRASYRNFWHPNVQFQMAGIRLARDVTP